MSKHNTKEWPEVYSCKFLEGGIVSYEDSNAGIALIKKETIDRMAPTFIGRPVIIQHKKVNPENFKEHAVGYVINVRFNPQDAWFYADFIVTDNEARRVIDEENYSVSCAYDVIDVKEGGLWHDIKYDGEITDGSFTHLALVESPRYEDSKITKQLPAMLVNGKAARHNLNNQEEEPMAIFKLWKKKENEKDLDASSLFVGIDEKAVPLGDVLLFCLNGKKLDFTGYSSVNDKQSYMAQDADVVDINGKTVSIGDLKAAYHYKMENEKKNCSCGATGDDKHKDDCTFNKKNEKSDEEKKKEEESKNAKEEEEKKKAEEEKENSKKKEEEAKALELRNAKEKEEFEAKNAKERSDAFFQELSNAGKQFTGEEPETTRPPMTRAERAAAYREKTNKKN